MEAYELLTIIICCEIQKLRHGLLILLRNGANPRILATLYY